MIPPKYSFYIGLDATLTWFDKGIGIDASGNFISSPTLISTYLFNIYNRCEAIYVDINTASVLDYIYFYDNSRQFISRSLIVRTSRFIAIPENATYIALCFEYDNAELQGKFNLPFVYMVKTAKPYYKELKKQYKKENNQEFFRISLEGSLSLHGNDFDFIYAADIEHSFVFLIYKSGVDAVYFKGKFNKTDCKFNISAKKCEPEIEPLDEYIAVLDKYDNTYDLIKLAPEITRVNAFKMPVLQIYVRGSDTITNFIEGTYFETDTQEAIDDDTELRGIYHFNFFKGANEIYITDAPDTNINGVYAGVDGVCYNEKGYRMELVPESYAGGYHVSIYSKTGVELYKTDTFGIISTDIQLHPYIPLNQSLIFKTSGGSEYCTADSTIAYALYARMLLNKETVTDSQGQHNTYDIPLDDFAFSGFNYKKCIGVDGLNVQCTSHAVDTPTKYGINDDRKYFSPDNLTAISGPFYWMPISRNSWANASLWFAYNATYQPWVFQYRDTFTIKDAYSISAVIKALLSKIAPNLSHEATEEYSRFLYSSNAPLPLMSRFYVFITPKSNILKGNYDQAAQKAEITFETLMDMLRKCFQCYWYIDGNKFIVEHISFFNNGKSYSTNTINPTIDITTLNDSFNKKNIGYFQTEIEYNKDILSSRYEFSWPDDSSQAFGPVNINVKSSYVSKDKTEDITPTGFSSDIDLMLSVPDNFSEDGFALLCPLLSGSEYTLNMQGAQLIDEYGKAYNALAQNWFASWNYLTLFYMWNMSSENIEIDTRTDLVVQDTIRCMNHTIELPLENDVDEVSIINTSIGLGKIEEISINLDTRYAEINLSYKPY